MSQKEQLQELLNKIHEIRQQKLMNLGALATRIITLDKQLEQVREEYKQVDVTERLRVIQYSSIINSYGKQKQLLGELRQILKDLAQLEAKYEIEIAKLGQ